MQLLARAQNVLRAKLLNPLVMNPKKTIHIENQITIRSNVFCVACINFAVSGSQQICH